MVQDETIADPRKVLEITPSQTVGPYVHIGFDWWPGSQDRVKRQVDCETTERDQIDVVGRVDDGLDRPVTDAIVETWAVYLPTEVSQLGEDYASNKLVRPTIAFGRWATDDEGIWRARLPKPDPLPTRDGEVEAPHVDIAIFARGLLKHLVTRMYLPDDGTHAMDPVLTAINDSRRCAALIAEQREQCFEFNIKLQGYANESVFFVID